MQSVFPVDDPLSRSPDPDTSWVGKGSNKDLFHNVAEAIGLSVSVKIAFYPSLPLPPPVLRLYGSYTHNVLMEARHCRVLDATERAGTKCGPFFWKHKGGSEGFGMPG